MLATGLRIIDTGARAQEIIAALPDDDYPTHFQPTYDDVYKLGSAISQLPVIGGTTSPQLIDHLRDRMASIAEGESEDAVVIAGWCAEPVHIMPPERMPHEVIATRQVAINALGKVLYFGRYAGQAAKPRSSKLQRLPNGVLVPSYMGDMINGQAVDERTPDPERMVYAARQAAWLESQVRRTVGEHVPTAHEALLLAYEMAYLRATTTGKRYLLSADMPWIGYRTNDPNGEHVKLLTGIENPIGVKIGPKNTAEDVAALAAKLNPDGQAGKLTFMIRLELEYYDDRLMPLLQAIKDYAPGSLIMYDIHGSTEIMSDGTKIRLVGNIITGIARLSEACESIGLRMHGPHLEVAAGRQECTDRPHQRPRHKSRVDAQLNYRQTGRVLTRAFVGQKALQAA